MSFADLLLAGDYFVVYEMVKEISEEHPSIRHIKRGLRHRLVTWVETNQKFKDKLLRDVDCNEFDQILLEARKICGEQEWKKLDDQFYQKSPQWEGNKEARDRALQEAYKKVDPEGRAREKMEWESTMWPIIRADQMKPQNEKWPILNLSGIYLYSKDDCNCSACVF